MPAVESLSPTQHLNRQVNLARAERDAAAEDIRALERKLAEATHRWRECCVKYNFYMMQMEGK
jgi:hypothetical protein